MSRIRANQITNQSADGAPTVQNGLVITGVTTSTSFSGDGSALTGITQTTINNNADNRIITGSGTANTLNGESNLFFNGSQLGVNVTPDSGVHLHVQNSGEANMILEGDVNGIGGYLMLKNNNTTANTSMAIQFLDGGGQGTSEIRGIYADNSNNEGHLAFSTRPSGGSMTERLRITSEGYLKIGGHSANRDVGGLSAQMVHLEGTSGSASISLINNQNSSGNSALYLGKSRGTSIGSNVILQNGDPMGSIVWCGSDGNDMISQGAVITAEVDGTPGSNDMPGRLVFKTTADGAATTTERLRIKSDGAVLLPTTGKLSVGPTNPVGRFTVGPANGSRVIEIEEYGVIRGYDRNSSAWAQIDFEASSYSFDCGGTERMKIDSNGQVTTPAQPSFRATKSGGGYNHSTGTFVWDQNQHNTGSNYNTSNGRFTAPVAGVYIFHAYSIYTGNSSNDTWDFQKNGSNFPGSRLHFTNTGVGGAWDNVTNTCIISLAANDYITLRASGQEYHGGDWTAFCGSLLG